MRMMKIITTLAACLFIITPLKAQDTTKSFYFPHKTGDMWEYFYFEFGTDDVDTVQNFIVSDSTDSKGFIYITQKARRVNPVERPLILWDSVTYWIDTVNNFVYGRGSEIGFDSLLVYKLDAKEGEKWVMCNCGGVGYQMARVVVKGEGTIFNKETTFMRIRYYDAIDSSDTTGLDSYVDEIADGFGLVLRFSAEYTGEVHLIGAIVNNTLYGDTTVVSVNDRKGNTPLSIKLYQNYPNPFNPSTTIIFDVSNLSNISLIIYDILGKEVYKLIDNKEFNAGVYKMVWNGLRKDGSKVASGIYFYRLITDKQSLSRSMILLK